VTVTEPTANQIVISSDCHGGASVMEYRDYLDPQWRDEFDAWRQKYSNPFRDLQSTGKERNWDSDFRIAEMNADGVVGEVLFPNTVPPFFPTGSLIAPPPRPDNLDRRWAGLQAHNRWLADFCTAAPARRAGVAQIFLNDVDRAVAEVEWTAQQGLRGGILLPGVPPDAGLPNLYSRVYDPLWAACQDHDVIIHHHTGSAQPQYGKEPIGWVMFAYETSWFAHRTLWHMILGGVFERFPRLKFVVTEQGTGWIPEVLQSLDGLHRRMQSGRTGEVPFADEVVLPMKPSEYWARNCWVGSSFPSPSEVAKRHEIGVDKIMWGSDYPHHEGVWPHTREHLRRSFHDVPDAELVKMLTTNAAEVYGFDLGALAPLAQGVGPTLEEIHTPLEQVPDGATSMSFYMA